jgi:hypothetical protein
MNGTKRVSKEVELRLALEEGLIAEAQRVGLHRTPAETVTSALEEYVRLRKQQNILCVYGDLETEGD